MNNFISSFNELLAAQNAELGSSLTISIGGITTGFVYEFPSTGQTLVADAYTEDGTSWIQCLASPFDAKPIVFQAPVILNGKTLQVVNVPESNHGIYRFRIGDATRS